MSRLENNRKAKNLVASIERGLDRMMTSPTGRLRAIRQELEREDSVRRHHVEVRTKERRETLEMAAKYLRSLPNS
jgi:hypothetical protein